MVKITSNYNNTFNNEFIHIHIYICVCIYYNIYNTLIFKLSCETNRNVKNTCVDCNNNSVWISFATTASTYEILNAQRRKLKHKKAPNINWILDYSRDTLKENCNCVTGLQLHTDFSVLFRQILWYPSTVGQHQQKDLSQQCCKIF